MAKQLDAGSLSAFFEGMSLMLAAGIQIDEAASLMGDQMAPGPFKDACEEVYEKTAAGSSLEAAMRATGRFPGHALDMVFAGEMSGRLENSLRSLAVYYSEEGRLRTKIRTSVAYPIAMLAVMTVILAFTVAVILPVFFGVYESFAGDVSAGAFSYVGASTVIGWVAFAVMAAITVAAIALAGAAVASRGRSGVDSLLEKLPLTRRAMYRHALSRFASLLATYVAAGYDSNESMRRALEGVDNDLLRRRVEAAYSQMIDPNQAKSLAQAVSDNDVLDPVYARMLTVGARAGSDDRVLQRLAEAYFEDAVAEMDSIIDRVEPALAVVLTVGVGAALVMVMLPLVGIMGSIG